MSTVVLITARKGFAILLAFSIFMFSETLFNFMFAGLMSYDNPPFSSWTFDSTGLYPPKINFFPMTPKIKFYGVVTFTSPKDQNK